MSKIISFFLIRQHRQSAGFAPDQLAAIKKNFDSRAKGGGGEGAEATIRTPEVIYVVRAIGLLPKSREHQQKLIDMLANHEIEGKQAVDMNWEDAVLFCRIW